MKEYHDLSDEELKKAANRRQHCDTDSDLTEQLIPNLADIKIDSERFDSQGNDSDSLTLLTELGLADTKDDFGEFQNGSMKDGPDDVFDKLLSDLNIH